MDTNVMFLTFCLHKNGGNGERERHGNNMRNEISRRK